MKLYLLCWTSETSEDRHSHSAQEYIQEANCDKTQQKLVVTATYTLTSIITARYRSVNSNTETL
jgi:hypothetical protein